MTKQQKPITDKEYAAQRGITSQAVTKQCRNNRLLPGIASYHKFGRKWMLFPEEKKINTLKD